MLWASPGIANRRENEIGQQGRRFRHTRFTGYPMGLVGQGAQEQVGGRGRREVADRRERRPLVIGREKRLQFLIDLAGAAGPVAMAGGPGRLEPGTVDEAWRQLGQNQVHGRATIVRAPDLAELDTAKHHRSGRDLAFGQGAEGLTLLKASIGGAIGGELLGTVSAEADVAGQIQNPADTEIFELGRAKVGHR